MSGFLTRAENRALRMTFWMESTRYYFKTNEQPPCYPVIQRSIIQTRGS